MVGRDLEAAEREVVVARREVVLVEQDLLGAAVAAPAAVDGVLLTFDGARVIAPLAVGHRRRRVGLLDAAADLVEDAVAQRRARREERLGVRVLGFEVGDHGRVVTVAHPVPVVDAVVAVDRQHMRAPRRVRRRRRCHR